MALVGAAVALVGAAVALVGAAVALVGAAVTSVGAAVAFEPSRRSAACGWSYAVGMHAHESPSAWQVGETTRIWQTRSVSFVGEATSHSPSEHVENVEQFRSLAPEGGTDSYCAAVHTVSGEHTRSAVAVGAVCSRVVVMRA